MLDNVRICAYLCCIMYTCVRISGYKGSFFFLVISNLVYYVCYMYGFVYICRPTCLFISVYVYKYFNDKFKFIYTSVYNANLYSMCRGTYHTTFYMHMIYITSVHSNINISLYVLSKKYINKPTYTNVQIYAFPGVSSVSTHK